MIGCSPNKDIDTSKDVKPVAQDYESTEDIATIEEREWYEEYDNPMIWLSYFWNLDTSINELQKESADFINKNDEVFPATNKEDNVYLVGLPIGMGGFDNVSGGYTNTVVTLGSYIEKIE